MAKIEVVDKTNPPVDTNPDGCDLCDNGSGEPLILRGRCHLTAPLLASMEGDVLTLRCYVPTCGKVVAVFEGCKLLPGYEKAVPFP